MVPLDMLLGREQLSNILRTGHSRIPVHTPGNPQDVVGLLLVKELVLLDPDDEVRQLRLCWWYGSTGAHCLVCCPPLIACQNRSMLGRCFARQQCVQMPTTACCSTGAGQHTASSQVANAFSRQVLLSQCLNSRLPVCATWCFE